ncbi:MAG: hypothetical protein GXP62_15500 [Oligoflexia bacterium]|nr:hypothetical protein [Oligoflexia bacterium]
MFDRIIARIPDDTRHRLEQARHDAWRKRREGQVRLWALSTRGLERAHDLLGDVPPAIGDPLIKLVDRGIAEATSVPIANYDQLNARTAASAVRGLGLLDLERISRLERATKDRKTVINAIARERERLLATPETRA